MARKKKKKLLQMIEITGVADKGRSVGRDAEGQVVFVENTVPGDLVDVVVTKQKRGFREGFPSHFHRYSEERIDAFCQHFGVCGGCKWQHLAYENQLKHKQDVVENAIIRIGKVEVGEFFPILPSLKTTYYRNKLEFTYSNKRWLTREEIDSGVSNLDDVLGFHRPRAFDKIVNIEHCFLQQEPSNRIRNVAREIAVEQELEFYNMREHTGYVRHLMMRITTLKQVMVILSFGKEHKEKREAYLDEMLRRLPEITSMHYCINEKLNDFILDLPIHTYNGPGYVEEDLGPVRFRISPKSFFQTNTHQAIRLFDKVVEFAELKGTENVYDLYTGIGSIALYVADKCKQVVGIEEVEPAIEDAIQNAERNNIDNAIFYAGDVRKILSVEFADKHGKPDLVITDPPRAGMHPKVVKLLLKLEAPRIVYVSCNPGTQARDLNLLREKYRVLKVQPVDMFPHTHHIETVALLEFKPQPTWSERMDQLDFLWEEFTYPNF